MIHFTLSLMVLASLLGGCASKPVAKPKAPRLPPTKAAVAGPQVRQGMWAIRDTQLLVRDVGPKEAPAIVVLHGGPGGNHRSMRVFEALAPAHRVVLYDQRGSGDSARLPVETKNPELSGLTLQQNVEDLEALRRKLGKDKITVVGHSWGGALAVFYAAAYPQRVEKLVVYSGGPETLALSKAKRAAHNALLTKAEGALLGKRMGGLIKAAKSGAPQAELDRRFVELASVLFPALYCERQAKGGGHEKVGHGEAGRGGFWANQAAGQYVATFRYADIAAGLAKLKAPTLLTWGRCEPSPVARLSNLLDHIADAQLVVFERSGHNAVEEQPDEFFATLRAFLAGKPLPEPAFRTREDLTAAVLARRRARLDTWGDRFSSWLYQGKLARLSRHFSPAMHKALPASKLSAFRDGALAQLGEEKRLLGKAHTVLPTASIYRRTARFGKQKAAQQLTWSLGNLDGATAPVILGMLLNPARRPAKTGRASYQTKAELSLPFAGKWLVFWGGRTLADNYHGVSAAQRFALDVVVAKDGKTHHGDGKRNEQYYCFGKPVLAAGAGKVVAVRDGQDDRQPGVLVKKQPMGNHVVIDHGNGEHSFYCHLQKGSLSVKRGDLVAAGKQLGRCGNSGHSSEAHLHFHLQDSRRSKGRGLPAQFQRYRANGKLVERGEPTQGQVIETAR